MTLQTNYGLLQIIFLKKLLLIYTLWEFKTMIDDKSLIFS